MIKEKLLQADGPEKNLIFQLLYQTTILVLPMVISPYLTRTLGSRALGIYTYTESVAYYFVVFAMLGIETHGQRIVALRRSSLTDLRRTFWSLWGIHIITSLVMLAAYGVYVFFFCQNDKNVALAQGIYVFSAALSITWLFSGLEKFKLIVLKNTTVRILEAICIFLFVKEPSHLLRYTLIICGFTCAGHCVMFSQVFSAIPPIRFTIKEMTDHLRPMLILFTVALAVSLYSVLDKTLLGILATKEDVAYYEYSHKLIKIPATFIGVIGSVLFPKSCRYAADEDFAALKKNFRYCLTFACFIGFAAFFGIRAVADLFAVEYYGEEFAVCGSVMRWMSFIILIKGIGEAIRCTYIYPLKHDTTMTKIVTSNAIANMIFSVPCILWLGIYGAVIGTIAAETTGLVLQLWLYRRYVSVAEHIRIMVPFIAIGYVMFLVITWISRFMASSLAALLIQILAGIVVYCALSFVYCYFFNSMMRGVIRNMTKGIREKISRKAKP